jgi:iron(III) transport system permease protein
MADVGGRVRLARRITPTGVLLGLAVVLAAALCLYPAFMLLRGSLLTGRIGHPGPPTLQNYFAIYGDVDTYALFGTTLVYALGTAVASVVVGLALAWIAVRTNAPLARHMSWLVFATYALPGTLTSIAWILLANPNTGLLNELGRAALGHDVTVFNVYSFLGMLFVAVGHSYALAFTFLAASLHSTDPSLEEQARMSGAQPLTVLRRVNLPLTLPALLSTMTILLILGLESFDVPAFVGIPANIRVFSTQIFIETTVRTPPDFGRAATFGVLPLLVALGLTWVYQRSVVAPERYATISGKAYRPRRVDLGRWRWVATAAFLGVFAVTAALPVATLVLVSLAPTLNAAKAFDVRTFGLANYATILADPVAQRAIRNTLTLAALGATTAMLLAFGVALATLRTKIRGRGVIEYVLFLPFALPSVVLGVGVLWGYVSFPIGVYGTIFILLIGYVTKFMPYGLRSMSTALLQIDAELEEQAKIAGASFGRVIARIMVPLILPGVVAGWTLLAVVFMREFSMSILLWSSGSEVVTVLFFDYWTNGRFGLVSALGLLLIAASLAIVFAARRVTRLDAVAA